MPKQNEARPAVDQERLIGGRLAGQLGARSHEQSVCRNNSEHYLQQREGRESREGGGGGGGSAGD